MLLFEPQVRRAAMNANLGEGPRYVVQRWAELLDENTHFSRSASAVLVPTVAVRELREEIQSYLGDGRAHFSNVLDALKRTRDTLRANRTTGTWFAAEQTALVTALAAVDPIPKAQDPDRWVTQKARALIANELQTFETAVDDPQTGYRARLLGLVHGSLAGAPGNAGAWRALDENISQLAAIALSEGRGSTSLALSAAQAFARAESDEDAADHFRALLERGKERYVVAACIDGASSIKRLDAFGCLPVKEPATWPNGNHGTGGAKLRQFLAARLDGRRRTCSVFVEVEALDHEHARTVAVAALERLHDHIAAEHRIARFSIHPEMLVLREGTNTLLRVGAREETVEQARPLGGRRLGTLERALRFHKLARGEEAAVVAVVQSWIAMENLARGAQANLPRGGSRRWVRQSPAAFLPKHVASVIYLAAARNQFTSSWHVARRACSGGPNSARFQQLARWLGVVAQRQWFVDLDRWLALLRAQPAVVAPDPLPLTATPAQAHAVLRDLLLEATPYVRVRIDEAAAMARRPARLSEWSSRIAQSADTNVSRLRMLRNRVVHGAMPEHESAQQVAAAGRHLLDAVFEVAPGWLSPGVPVWKALYSARIWQEGLRRRWRTPGSQLAVSVDAIVRGQ